MKFISRIAIVVVLALVPAVALAQPAPRTAARDGWRAYNDGDYDNALRLLNLAAGDLSLFSAKEKAMLYQFIAYCHVAFERREEAKFAFKRALSFNESLALDRSKVSPSIVEVFEQAKHELELAARGTTGSGAAAATSSEASLPVPPSEDAAGALWRTAAAPGWGQLYSERKLPGYVVAGVNGAAIGSAIYFTVASAVADGYAQDVRDRGNTDPDTLQNSKDFRAYRNIALGTALGVWALSAVEAYGGVKWWGASDESDRSHVQLAPVVTPDGGAVFVSVTF